MVHLIRLACHPISLFIQHPVSAYLPPVVQIMHPQRQLLVTELFELLRTRKLHLMMGKRRGKSWIQH